MVAGLESTRMEEPRAPEDLEFENAVMRRALELLLLHDRGIDVDGTRRTGTDMMHSLRNWNRVIKVARLALEGKPAPAELLRGEGRKGGRDAS